MNRTKVICALLLAGALGSCQKDKIDQEAVDETTDQVNFTFSASSGGPTFRTGHAAGEGKLVVTWLKDDKIGLYSVVGTETKNGNATFTVKEDNDITEGGKKAVFSGEISQSADWDMSFYAYYPYSSGQSDATKIAVNVADQVIDGKESKHLAKYDVLVADPVTGVKAGAENTSLNFKHVMAIADLKISIPTGAEAEQIREIKILRPEGKRISTAGTINITAAAEADRLKITATQQQTSYAQLTKVENVTLAAGESFQARVALLPDDWSGETVAIYVTTDKGTYQFDKTNIKTEAGKRYTSDLVLQNKLSVTAGDYYYADGTWSTERNTNKTIVGVVAYAGQKGGASNGYVMALDSIRMKSAGKKIEFNIPEVPNLVYLLNPTRPDGEDWAGKAHAQAVAAKKDQNGYKDMEFILSSLEYEVEGVIEGPAKKGNWFTPAISQLMAPFDQITSIKAKIVAVGGNDPTVIPRGQGSYVSSTEAAGPANTPDLDRYNTVTGWSVNYAGLIVNYPGIRGGGINHLRPFLEF